MKCKACGPRNVVKQSYGHKKLGAIRSSSRDKIEHSAKLPSQVETDSDSVALQGSSIFMNKC